MPSPTDDADTKSWLRLELQDDFDEELEQEVDDVRIPPSFVTFTKLGDQLRRDFLAGTGVLRTEWFHRNPTPGPATGLGCRPRIVNLLDGAESGAGSACKRSRQPRPHARPIARPVAT